MKTREDMVEDEVSFLENIIDFFEIPRSAFTYTPAEKTVQNNFRKGMVDEWVDVFNAGQKALSAEIIGPDLMSRFGWRQLEH